MGSSGSKWQRTAYMWQIQMCTLFNLARFHWALDIFPTYPLLDRDFISTIVICWWDSCPDYSVNRLRLAYWISYINRYGSRCVLTQVFRGSHVLFLLGGAHTLNWNKHVDHVCKKISKRIFALKKMKLYMDLKTRNLFFNAYILPHFDYCNTIWGHSSSEIQTRMLKLQKKSARYIYLMRITLIQAEVSLKH